MKQENGRELALLADQLAALAKRLEDGREPSTVVDRPPSKTSKAMSPLAAVAHDMLRARERRGHYISGDLLGEPVWDMLLDLFLSEELGKRVSVSSATIAAGVPPTTGLRYLTLLVDRGLIERWQDPKDARRVFVALSAETRQKLSAYLAAYVK